MTAKRATWRERSKLVRYWRLFRTRRPHTFTEKVRYKMLRDHRRILVQFADKAAARDYVTRVVGERYLPKLFGLVTDPAELRSVELPFPCVIKPTHGSGVLIVVSDGAPADARLPELDGSWVYRHVRPEAIDRTHLALLGARWLDQLYGQGPNNEWAYVHVPRQIMIEEFLAAPDGGTPDDYKLFVFHGVCAYIQVDAGRFGEHTQDFYRPDWQHLELSGGPPFSAQPRARPDRLAEMIDIAQRLGAETDFVRVDLYLLTDRVVVGELTSYPAGGHSPFYPARFDEEFGSHWTVPKRYVADANRAVRG